MTSSIMVAGLGKRYRHSHANKPLTLQEAVVAGWRNMKPQINSWALRDVTFTAMPGETLGVIGKNGAGKSTLIKTLGGVLKADEGIIKVKGRVCALLDPGGSFHRDLSGRENARIGGVMSGLSRAEASRSLESIIEFAELESAIDSPIRAYSSGMKMRLSFSIAVHSQPQVLLVDEVLAVGDLSFQAKCLERIAQLKSEGCTLVFVSHSMDQIERYSDRVLYLRQGKVVIQGNPTDVRKVYESDAYSGALT